jgi:hypothetical protein
LPFDTDPNLKLDGKPSDLFPVSFANVWTDERYADYVPI